MSEPVTLLEMLQAVADEAFERWDKDMRAGKLLTALSGRIANYDPRVTAIRNALAGHAANLARIAELEAALQEIACAHLGDQPAEAPGDDYAWACQHIGKLRCIALDAMSTPS